VLSPQSLPHAAVIAASDPFLDELSFSSEEIFESLLNVSLLSQLLTFLFGYLKRKSDVEKSQTNSTIHWYKYFAACTKGECKWFYLSPVILIVCQNIINYD